MVSICFLAATLPSLASEDVRPHGMELVHGKELMNFVSV